MSWFTSSSSSSSLKKSKILAQFMSITTQNSEVGEQVLKANGYQLEPALEEYYMNRSKYPETGLPSPASLSKLEKVFDNYTEDDKDCISSNGLVQFYGDIGVDLAHRWTLFIAHLMKAAEPMKFTKKEFIGFFGKQKAFTITDIKKTCERECRSIEKSEMKFEDFYIWLFSHVKENQDKRSIPKDFAVQLWSIVLPKDEYPLLDDLLTFTLGHKETKAITLDTWTVVREFLKTCKDPENFENDGAWPTLVDEYLDAKMQS